MVHSSAKSLTWGYGRGIESTVTVAPRCKMPTSAVQSFNEPNDYAASIRGAKAELHSSWQRTVHRQNHPHRF